MAVEADRVVVELIAQTQGFDTQIKRSGDAFASTMSDVTKASKGVESAANDVYTAHNRMGIATNNARIAQMELQHVVRGSVDSFASGASASTIFAQHIASVAEAASFMGGSLGAVGEILSGPWGIAITAGVAILATLISRHKEEAESVDTLVEKLKKNHEHTLLQNEADEIWSNTLDGLIDRLTKLNDQDSKRLVLPSVANTQDFAEAQAHVDHIQSQINAAEAKGQDTAKLYTALSAAVIQLYQKTIILGQQQGEVYSDLTKRAQTWAEAQHAAMFGETATINGKDRTIAGLFGHPELGAFAGQLEAAFQKVKSAVDDAAKANVPFDAVTNQVDALNHKLAASPTFIKDYIANLQGLAAQLESTVETAKNAPKAIADFEKAVVGAEGTGQNRMGSSAAGIGQFMPSTWLSYFNRLFPQFADMTDTAKLDQRNVPSTAKAVIEAAAQDYAAALKKAGVAITETSLYAMHVLGTRDALKLLNAPGGQQTSDFLSSRVLAGNPFLRGTASDALGRIGQRIGDSSSSASSAAVEIERELTGWTEKNAAAVAKSLGTEVEVGVTKEHQVSLAEELLHGNENLSDLIRSDIIPGLKDWDKEYQQIIDSMAEANRFGAQLVDDILNPDNWDNWGDAARKVLHEVLQEILLLGAANPLKNLLFGQHNPTLGSIFGQLFGGGGGGLNIGNIIAGGTGSLDPIMAIPTASIPHFASGGIMGVGGSGGDNNLLSINGQPRAFVGGREKLAIIPSNAVAAAAGGGGSSGVVHVVIEASPYFDGRVMQVSGPVIAQASVAAAQGGASIGRRNLGRESMHRLE